MDWDDYFRQQATMYRELAQKTEYSFIKQELLELAAVCEEVANNIEDRQTGGYDSGVVASNTTHTPWASIRFNMSPFLFRGPTTNFQVQGWIADDPSENGRRTV
jgi:hypothetical protein